MAEHYVAFVFSLLLPAVLSQQVLFPTQTGDNTDFVELNRQMQANERFIDRRLTDGWWVMYPFGELYYDVELLNQPNLDRQIDLDFYFPFYGFRFNYSFIIPNGIVAFARPEWIQPPYTFPNPKWPERRDPSFIAPFFADSTYQYVGETGISHVWYRTVHRPRQESFEGNYVGPDQGLPAAPLPPLAPNPFNTAATGFQNRQTVYGNVRRQPGYVEDEALLNNITRDIQEGIVGASGFQATHALIVTWERMAYGGAPKVVEVNLMNEVRRWQNTYQVILASDEIRSYVMFNYGTINWTASNEAGALRGRGGKQAAIAGFNGGNGTGFKALPYNGEGQMFKLARYSSVNWPGRWIFRVDEEIIPGGCSNESIGYMYVAPNRGTMLGGLAVNVSGPCIRSGDRVVVLFDEFAIQCQIFNMARARCILPKFHKIGLINTKISRDGGMSFPYVGSFYVVAPDRSEPNVLLIENALKPQNKFANPYAEELSIRWSALNLTGNPNARVNVELWGYWEDTESSSFEKVGILAESQANTGRYTFNPKTLNRASSAADQASLSDMWKWYSFGSIRVAVVTDREDDTENVFYSHLTPFAWYFVKDWQYEYGNNWALDKCLEWYDYDGRRRNFIRDLEPCPCVLDQALLDMGRYMPVMTCNRLGDSGCPHNRGARHCVQSVQASWTGSQQTCCYDFEGWLMFSDDYENFDRLKYYSPGTPFRAHTFGSYPYKIPPFIPNLSNYNNDLMPYQMCCQYAEHCEFFFWRRQTNGCQDYRPPAAGFAYGEPHFITYDNVRYTFNGKGYYVLTMADHAWHKLTVQVRMEQPPKTLWNTYPNATVITGVAIRENDSDIVQIMARKEFRRWRYRTDVLVRGIPRFFDSPEWKYQQFRGVSLYSPARNMNQSEIIVHLRSGAGVRISEAFGVLDVTVLLPPSFNMTYKRRRFTEGVGFENVDEFGNPLPTAPGSFGGRMEDYYKTGGLLGVFNGDPRDDFISPGSSSSVITPSNIIMNTESDSRAIYFQFGETWRVDGSNPLLGPVLFQDTVRPIYNPLIFYDRNENWSPEFLARIPFNATYIFSNREVRDACQDNWACRYDYATTGVREIALNTLSVEQKFIGLKELGSRQLVSCGPLLKAQGAVKTPLGNNYLDGVTVTFTCRPEYFIHGDPQRTCVNGSWSPGWHVWCRSRPLEIGLKWMTGILSAIGIIGIIAAIYCMCYMKNVRPKQKEARERRSRQRAQPPIVASSARDNLAPMAVEKVPPTSNNNVAMLASEPRGNNSYNGLDQGFSRSPKVYLHQTTAA